MYADVVTSSADYARRFSGSVGSWFIDRQSEILSRFLKNLDVSTVLDVAGGHGQVIRALKGKGYKLTVLGSTESCKEQIQTYVDSGDCSFEIGSVEKLKFEDNSFDVVTCFRYLSHTDNWQEVISELCRVAAKAVIIDFPPKVSFNALSPFLYELKRTFEGNTRPFLIFRCSEIRNEFAKHNFKSEQYAPQFFFPMVLHRVLGAPRISRALEYVPTWTGLTYFFGSPVVECFIKTGVV